MYRFLVAIYIFLLAGCATVDYVPTDYAGPDAGKVVIGIGAATGTWYSSYSFLFRKRGPSANGEKSATGRFIYYQSNMFYGQVPDYRSSTESGVVLVHSLPPGEYEIYNFSIFENGGTVQSHYGSRAVFSIPFSVKPGQATYLGNYQANKLTGRNFLGLPLPAGAAFVVTDRISADLSIAETKTKAKLGAGQNATPEPSQIGNPFFASHQHANDGK